MKTTLTTKFTIFIGLSLSANSFAQNLPLEFVPSLNTQQVTSVECPNTFERFEGYSIQRLLTRNGDNCLIHVSPTEVWDMIYRSYVFTSEGEFLVFNSYGNGNQSQMTGARDYFIFPRKNTVPTYRWDHDKKELIVTMASDREVIFDYNIGQLKSISDADLQIAKDIHPNNKGGVEITLHSGILMDAGFKKGGTPIMNPKNSSSFIFNKKRCSFPNSQLFKYTETQDAIFKYDDQWLIPFLQERCPNLGL